MQAAFYHGDKKISLGEGSVQAPVVGEVRLEVAYCGVCGTDLHIYLENMDNKRCKQCIYRSLRACLIAQSNLCLTKP